MIRKSGTFLYHGRCESISTLADVSRDKQKHHGDKGKGRACRGVSYKCKLGKHNECFSMTCTCECGHRSAP